ncbi:MAG: SWF/SNF helicase family protein, partial [Myxococcales bacterium]|nr:SWF/SNF helicase family protein [Myxococcales bacterium]
HRSLVFSQWPSFLDHVAAALDHAGIAHLRLDGRTRDRPAVLRSWQDPAGPPVFLIRTKAGGVGLDLSAADHVFHLDPWWNPAAEDQATDRAHRIGQTRPVMVYKLVAADTVEDKILELQDRKRRLFQATVDADRLEVDALSRADLEAVFAGRDELEADGGESDEDDFLELERNELEREAARDELERRGPSGEFVPLSPVRDQRVLAQEAADGPEAQVIALFPRRNPS